MFLNTLVAVAVSAAFVTGAFAGERWEQLALFGTDGLGKLVQQQTRTR